MIKPDPEPLSRRSTNESLHAHSARYDSSVDASPYETPVPRQLRRLYPAIGTPGRQSESASVAPSVASEYEATEALADVADGDADRAKLKGIFWPGMSLFDSATPDQKRKRNQRKDVKVVRNMEQVAAGVEPIECIWSEDISLQRTRDIYATPSPVGSPVCAFRPITFLSHATANADVVWWFRSLRARRKLHRPRRNELVDRQLRLLSQGPDVCQTGSAARRKDQSPPTA